MNWIRHLPIKRKLNLVVGVTCLAVLVPMCVALVFYQIFDYRRALARDTTVLADVLARNSEANLAFRDEDGARKTLLALEVEPTITAACLYDAQDGLFAQYTRGGSKVDFPARVPAFDSHFEPDWLAVARPVLLHDKRIGTIYLQAGLNGVHDRLLWSMKIGFPVLLICVLAALALSSELQRPISQPILALAQTAKSVAQRHDYSVRAAPQEGQEIGLLTDAFNLMLSQIQEQHDKFQTQLERLKLLDQITRSISERQDLFSIYQVVISRLEEHLPVDFACVCGHDAVANILSVTCFGVRSASPALAMALTVKSEIGIDQNGLARCLQGQLVYEPDTSDVQFRFPQRLAAAGLRSVVFAPLQVESQIFGILVAARRQPHGFSSADCEFLKQLSEHVALAAHQAQLYNALQRAFDELRQTQQTAMQQERLRALGQMASGIAHDINNAISPVSLYTESLLETEPNLSERARGYLQTIQRSIDDVAHTVARMREFYRQRETKLTSAAVAINELMRQVIDLTRARWSDIPQQNGSVIQLNTQLEADLPALLGVESEIREALVNLIFNAADAMPAGGTLTLRTKLAAGGEARMAVAVEVCDTGVGMDEETRRRCLEPFFTTKGERGTGLGLAMVYGIVRRHAGDIAIESEAGKDTNFPVAFSHWRRGPRTRETRGRSRRPVAPTHFNCGR
jgi:signal transduction histidine kinase